MRGCRRRWDGDGRRLAAGAAEMGAELVEQVLGMCDEVLAAVRRKLAEKGAWRTPLVVGGPSLGC